MTTGDPVFPDEGTPADELLAEMDDLRREDIDWRGGHAFSLVYHPADEGLEHVLHEAAARFLHENALNPFAYASLPTMERDITAMAADLLDGPADAACLTSGGTESIFLAVQTARDEARARGVDRPELLTAGTAHPAFAKACSYLDVAHRKLEVGEDLRLTGDAVADSLGEQTALVVASAPCYPYGVIDHVTDVAAVAADAGVLCHVDACLGGWLLPFWAEIGEPVPPWSLAVDGVTSISADVHKYGYAFKGASVLAYRDKDLLDRQLFLYDEWPGGLYGSRTTAGTRPGAPIAGAWAAIRYLGRAGYRRMAQTVRDTTRAFREGIDALPGVEVTGDPDMSVFQFAGPGVDIGGVADVMDERGWNLDRQQGGLHVMVSPYHARVAERFLRDLAAAVADHGEGSDHDAVYGGVV